MKFSELFKESRINLNLSQMEIAKKLKVSQGAISKIENDILIPRADLFLRLLKLRSQDKNEIINYFIHKFK